MVETKDSTLRMLVAFSAAQSYSVSSSNPVDFVLPLFQPIAADRNGRQFVAAELAQKYGLVPPDHSGIWGLGETLNYASQRLLTRHSLAREFSRSQISQRPFPNELAPLGDAFKRLQSAGFADWRLAVDGSRLGPRLG